MWVVLKIVVLAITACTFMVGEAWSSHVQDHPSVSGAGTTIGNLEIAPAADPLTAPLSLRGGPTVLFVKRMPVTKAITRVVLGDFARAAGCAADVRVRLYVRHHRDGRLRGGDDVQAAYSEPTPVGPELGQVSFGLTLDSGFGTGSTLTLKKGNAYSFSLFRVDGCSSGLLQRTWRHEGRLESAPCDFMPPYGPDSITSGDRRMWHVSGQADADPRCVNHGFDATQPDGWARVGETQYYKFIATSNRSPTSTMPPCGRSDVAARGCSETYWRPVPNSNSSEYVHHWSQFAPPETESANGWYYGLPWRDERAGARDVYARLETIDYRGLLLKYAPVLRHDSQEQYFTLSAAAATDHHWPYDDDPFGEGGNLLVGSGGAAIASANPDNPYFPRLDLGWLRAGAYPDGTVVQSDDHLDFQDHFAESSVRMEDRGYGDRVYARAFQDAQGGLWLQYYLFYYYSEFLQSGSGNHEGDWEKVQVRLDQANLRPIRATYAFHYERAGCDWSLIEKLGDRPVVYVARGRHGSYFEPQAGAPVFADWTDGYFLRYPATEVLEEDSSSHAWLAWPGRWGESVSSYPADPSSPQGPAAQPQWQDPAGWEAGAQACPLPNAARIARARTTGTRPRPGQPPQIAAVKTPRRQLRVTWVVPKRATHLVISLHAAREQSAHFARTLRVKRRRGVVTLALPKLRRTNVIRASALAGGRRSRVLVTRVR